MTQRLDTLQAALEAAFGETLKSLVATAARSRITVAAADYLAWPATLRDDPTLRSSS
jgi:NADH-quinone oxidoreductase subunit C